MKVIGFIGVGNYSEVKYELNGETKVTKFSPVALASILRADKVVLFFTQQSFEKHSKGVADELNAIGAVYEYTIIPWGLDESERWEIFEKVLNSVNEEERVAVDITHSFRSIPFTAFLSIIFMRDIKKVNLQGVYYGAFEAKRGNSVPFVNIEESVFVLEWYNAAREFIKYGKGGPFYQIIEKRTIPFFKEGSFKPVLSKKFAEKVKDISSSIEFLSIPQLAKGVKGLKKLWQEHKGEIIGEMQSVARPGAIILENIYNAYSDFENTEDLKTFLDFIRWLIDREDVYRAFICMREWLINWVLIKVLNVEDILKRENREPVEKFFGIGNQLLRKSSKSKEKDEMDSSVKEVFKAWSSVSNYRNFMAHCGFTENPLRFRKTVMESHKLCDTLESLLEMGEEARREVKKIYEQLINSPQ